MYVGEVMYLALASHKFNLTDKPWPIVYHPQGRHVALSSTFENADLGDPFLSRFISPFNTGNWQPET